MKIKIIKKSIIASFAIITLFTGCGDKVLREKETQIKDNLLYQINAKEPFTGIVKGTNPKGANPTAQITWERKYQNGKQDGTEKWWYVSGKICRKSIFKNGYEDGIWKKWYKNGQIEWEAEFKNGKLNGEWKLWYESGVIKLKIEYKNAKRDGIYKFWHENGKLIKEENYKNGVLQK